MSDVIHFHSKENWKIMPKDAPWDPPSIRWPRREPPPQKRLPQLPRAGAADRLRFVFVVAFTILLFAGAGVTGAAHAATVNYVALGDSYSSGVGAGDYDTNDPACKRSANAYPQRWVKEFSLEPVAKFTFVACSGATTAEVESQQLSSLSAETTMVTMTVGGNDLGFSPLVAECLLTSAFSESACISTVLAAGVMAKKSMPATLDALYKKVKERAPNAKVFILGYPHIFETGGCGMFGLSAAVRQAINSSTSLLNEVILEAAIENGFLFVDGEQAFFGRGVCTTVDGGAWLTDTGAQSDLYHPNRDGHEAYAVFLDARVRDVKPF